MGFGKILQNKLKELDMTVAELSRKTKISTNTLYAIIRRDSENTKAEYSIKIAEALHVSLFDLICPEGEAYDTKAMQNASAIINHIEYSFNTVLLNIGYKVELLDNGDCRIFDPYNKELILSGGEYEHLQEEIYNYIRYILSNLFSK